MEGSGYLREVALLPTAVTERQGRARPRVVLLRLAELAFHLLLLGLLPAQLLPRRSSSNRQATDTTLSMSIHPRDINHFYIKFDLKTFKHNLQNVITTSCVL